MLHHGCIARASSFGMEGRSSALSMRGTGSRTWKLHRGYTKQPLYGVDVGSWREFCSEHQEGRDGALEKKRRLHEECCSKALIFGADGTDKVEFCSEYKRGGMVDLR